MGGGAYKNMRLGIWEPQDSRITAVRSPRYRVPVPPVQSHGRGCRSTGSRPVACLPGRFKLFQLLQDAVFLQFL
jgi:hypothetical protein